MLRHGIISNPTGIIWNHATANVSRMIVREFASATSKPSSKLHGIYPLASTRLHSDLDSFLEHSKRRGLDEKSTVFTGTRYEYLVAERLARYGFSLRRIGGASDFGIDLVGDWTVPSTSRTIRVLIQCKGGDQKAGPHLIRELEGSFVGAPPGWRGAGVLGLLVTESRATKGMRDALARAPVPMGYFCCSGAGVVRQMLWNQRAEDQGLEGVDVALRRGGDEQDSDEVMLVKDGEPLPFVA